MVNRRATIEVDPSPPPPPAMMTITATATATMDIRKIRRSTQKLDGFFEVASVVDVLFIVTDDFMYCGYDFYNMVSDINGFSLDFVFSR